MKVLVDKLALQRYSVRKEGDLLHFRNNLHFLDRTKEVPESLLLPWRRQVEAEGRVTLDHLATLAAQVDGARFQGLTQWWRGYFETGPAGDPDLADQLRRHQRHLLFWSSLSETQRRVARGGGDLSILQMTVPQRQRLLAALEPSGEDRIAPRPRHTLNPEEWPSLLFRLERHEVQEQEFREDHPGRTPLQYPRRLDPSRPLNLPVGTLPVGEPRLLEDMEFVYTVAGQETPLSRATITLRRPSAN
jgi:hypothetical protein